MATAWSDAFHMSIAVVSTLVALAGIGLAAYFYLGERREIGRVTAFMQSVWGLKLYRLSYNKFYIDAIYHVLCRLAAAVAGRRQLAGRSLCDRSAGEPVRRRAASLSARCCDLQTGLVQFYALAMVLGVLVLIGTLLSGWSGSMTLVSSKLWSTTHENPLFMINLLVISVFLPLLGAVADWPCCRGKGQAAARRLAPDHLAGHAACSSARRARLPGPGKSLRYRWRLVLALVDSTSGSAWASTA